MKIKDNLHQIKTCFKITEKIERFVYLYVIVGKKIHVIDTGVSGTEELISEYLTGLGRSIYEVESVLLTHSHPDHIGSAQAIKALSHSTVFACEQEKNWIEDINIQFRERPIPNFYGLVSESVVVDRIIKDNDILNLEDGITLKVIETAGHSQGHLSFQWIEEAVLFTGDTVPVIGDIPIYISPSQSIDSLRKLLLVDGIHYYLSAWDNVFEEENGANNIKKSLEHLTLIESTVKGILLANPSLNQEEIYTKICSELDLDHLIDNPLFRGSIYSNIAEGRGLK